MGLASMILGQSNIEYRQQRELFNRQLQEDPNFSLQRFWLTMITHLTLVVL